MPKAGGAPTVDYAYVDVFKTTLRIVQLLAALVISMYNDM